MDTPKDKSSQKSPFCNASNDQEGAQKLTKLSGYEQLKNEALKIQLNDNQNTLCSDISICSVELEDLPWQPSNLGEYRQLSLLKSIPTLKQSCDRTSQEFQFTQISETTSQTQENLTLSQWDFPAQAQVTQELERDSNIQLPLFGEKDLEYWSRLNPASVLSNSLKELSNEDFELFLADLDWQDTLGKLAMCRRESLGRVIEDSDYLSFPTLLSGQSSTTSRPAGRSKCEKWFKDNGLIPNGSQLGTQAIALTMGFPSNWFESLTQQYSKNPTTPSLVEPQAELEPGILQDEQLHQPKQRSLSVESSTSTVLSDAPGVLEHEKKRSQSGSEVLLGGDEKLSDAPGVLEQKRGERSSLNKGLSVPCLVKQPKQPEVEGVIRKVLRDRFLVEVDGQEISVSKLFVYPDLDNCSSKKYKTTAGEQNEKVSDTSVKCSSNTPPPSTQCSSKTRRYKGEGSGHIYYRNVTRNGKSYQQAYYQWRENGRQRTKYISKKLLSKVEEAEALKLPVSEILVLLGGTDKCSSKSSDTSIAPIKDEVIDTNNECSSKVAPPSKNRRTKGKGSGWIECKPIKRSGKEYKQYWYHYEEWREGDRVSKKSRYIPKRLVARVEKMEAEKVPVKDILAVLGGGNRRFAPYSAASS